MSMDLLPLLLLGIGWYISFRNAMKRRREEAEKLNTGQSKVDLNSTTRSQRHSNENKSAQTPSTTEGRSDFLQSILNQVQEIAEDQSTNERIKTYQEKYSQRRNEGAQTRSKETKPEVKTTTQQMSMRPSLSKEMSIEESMRLKQDRLDKKQQNLREKALPSQTNTRTVFGQDDFYDRLMRGELDQEVEVEHKGRKSVKTMKVDNKELRRAIIMKEILDKPVSLK